MVRSRVTLVVAALVMGGWFVAARADEPMLMRLAWKPGEVHKYAGQIEINVHIQGQTMATSMSMPIEIRVVDGPGPGGADGAASGGLPAEPGSFRLGKLIHADVVHGDVNQTVRFGGRRVEVTVTKDEIQARVNGGTMPSYQLSQLRRELKPLQDLLKSTDGASTCGQPGTTVTGSPRVMPTPCAGPRRRRHAPVISVRVPSS